MSTSNRRKYDGAVIRADASCQIGMGHLYRCLALALELKKEGIPVTFLMRDVSPAGEEMLAGAGMEVCRLPVLAELDSFRGGTEDYISLEKTLLERELDGSRAALQALVGGERKKLLLILDKYCLDYRYEEAVQAYAEDILVIDDLADRCHACSYLIDQTYAEDCDARYRGLLPAGCRKLLGPDWLLLRPDFAGWRGKRVFRDEVRNILVSFGGSDAADDSGKVAAALQERIMKNRQQLIVVVGAEYPHLDSLRHVAGNCGNIRILQNISNMAEVLADADYAFGSGGISLWERCCLGVPAAVASTADNQLGSIRALQEKNAICYLGKSSELTPDDYIRAYENIGKIDLAAVRAAGMALVDGQGAARAVQEVIREGD